MSPVYANPKPEPRSRAKRRKDYQHAKDRAACVAEVYERDRLCCRCCLKVLVKPFATDNVFQWAHVHELVPKSLGGDDTEPSNCYVLCHRCHLDGIHGERLLVSGNNANDPNGITFERL